MCEENIYWQLYATHFSLSIELGKKSLAMCVLCLFTKTNCQYIYTWNGNCDVTPSLVSPLLGCTVQKAKHAKIEGPNTTTLSETAATILHTGVFITAILKVLKVSCYSCVPNSRPNSSITFYSISLQKALLIATSSLNLWLNFHFKNLPKVSPFL